MTNKWRRKGTSGSKPDDTAEVVWGDDDAVEGEQPSEAGPVEEGGSGAAGPSPEATSAPATSPVEPDAQPAPTDGKAVDQAEDQAEASEAPSDQPSDEVASPAAGPQAATDAPTGASAPTSDQFDALGAEVAGVLRRTRELVDRVRAEADEHALAVTAEAEEQARSTIAEAEQQASDHRAEVEGEIEQQRAEVARQIEEAAGVLEAAEARDRLLRREAEQHLADALAARDAGRAILERATAQLVRAEAVAQDLAAQVEAARLEVGPITAELRSLAAQFSAVVLSERGAVGPHGGTGDDSSVIDLRDSSTSSPDDGAVAPAVPEPPGDQDVHADDDPPSGEGPTTSTGAAEQH
jgi:hypothetical protein